MSLITPQIEHYIQTQSWIRRMFEAASELKSRVGADQVFDFSLGNPDVPPPPQVSRALAEIAEKAHSPMSLGYGPNAGLPSLRAKLAEWVSVQQQTEVSAQHIVITSGAAGALNTIFRTILTPGDQVVCFAPYFVEYGFYAGNYGGVLKPVNTKAPDFRVDADALDHAITPKTRAMIINSPNNPTGVIYSQQDLDQIAAVLSAKSKQYGKPILLLSDEPYRFLAFDDVKVPPVLPAYSHSIVVSSFSKSLSLAGERIGYLAVHSQMPEGDLLPAGLTLANRILGFVNAPMIGQLIIQYALSAGVDVSIYDERRKAMAAVLDEVGIEYTMPKGAFYFFPKAPDGYDDKSFVDLLLTENIIAVPGKGFGYPGYFRLTYCVDKAIIERSLPAWQRIMGKQ